MWTFFATPAGCQSSDTEIGYDFKVRWNTCRTPRVIELLTSLVTGTDVHWKKGVHAMDTVEIRFSAVRSPRFSVSGYGTKWRMRTVLIVLHSSSSRSSSHKLCTRKTMLALVVRFYLYVKWICMAMATNAEQIIWHQISISVVSTQWQTITCLMCRVTRGATQSSNKNDLQMNY